MNQVWASTTKSGKIVALRNLVSSDRESLIKFFSSMSPEALEWGLPPYSDDVIDRWINSMQDRIAIVATYENAIVGFSMINKNNRSDRRKGVGELAMYVHQNFQNDGIGALMLDWSLAAAKKESMHKINLYVVAENKIAVHLYAKFGFEKEGILREAYFGRDKHYHDELIMGKVLSSS